MEFKDYEKQSKKTAIYPKDKKYTYLFLGLASEAGEVASKFKKVIRDKDGKIDEKAKRDIEKELGDVLWYVSQLSRELDITLERVAKTNLEKLMSREEREKLSGDGDDR